VDPPEKKGARVIVEVLRRLPVVHVDNNIKFVLLDLLLAQLPPSLTSWSPLKEVMKESAAIKNHYMLKMDEVLARYAFLLFFLLSIYIYRKSSMTRDFVTMSDDDRK
jgi:hypothetical protein